MGHMNTATTLTVVRGDTVQNEVLFTVLENGHPLHMNWRFTEAVKAFFWKLVSLKSSGIPVFSAKGEHHGSRSLIVSPLSEWLGGFNRSVVFEKEFEDSERLAEVLWRLPMVYQNAFATVRTSTDMGVKSPASYFLEKVSTNESAFTGLPVFLVYYGLEETVDNCVGKLTAEDTPKLGRVYTMTCEGKEMKAVSGLSLENNLDFLVCRDPQGYLIRRALYQYEVRLRLRPEDAIL